MSRYTHLHLGFSAANGRPHSGGVHVGYIAKGRAAYTLKAPHVLLPIGTKRGSNRILHTVPAFIAAQNILGTTWPQLSGLLLL